VRSNPRSREFEEKFLESHKVYHKYQTTIHQDPPSKPNEQQYTRFLVDSPLAEVPRSVLTVRVVLLCNAQVKLVSDVFPLHKESYSIFKKYQMTIHNEKESDCTESDFDGFLVDSPLVSTAACCICYL